MLSILIPTYQYNSFPLIKELCTQGSNLDIAFEIICFDDGSPTEFNVENQRINAFEFCFFKSLPKNVGLSENRNLLAKQARYPYLLFIDGDSRICRSDYLAQYIAKLPFQGIIYGGRIHPDVCPSPQQSFRWKYGKYREDKSVDVRNQNPYRSLLFNNSCIEKKCFENIRFDSEVRTYGHEDTLFAYTAQQSKLHVIHIDNPIEHKDIDYNLVFFQKMQSSIRNLHLLHSKGSIPNEFVRLLQFYKKLNYYGLDYLISKIYPKVAPYIQKNLVSNKPLLRVSDIFKIGYFCYLKRSN